jgi:hypothetical protein
VFDPERDEEQRNAHWWHRLLAVGALTLLVSLTLGPSLTPYRSASVVSSATPATCLPLRDGWTSVGPCAPVSHQRIELSVVLLGVLAALILLALVLVHFHRTRTNLRTVSAPGTLQ